MENREMALPVRAVKIHYLYSLKHLYMKFTLTGLFSLFLLLQVSAQEVQINEEPGISDLFSSWVENNRAKPRISGWRVQIMSTTDRTQVESGRERFRQEYPEVPAAWLLEKPYYKLRVGAFRTKQEAMAFIAALEGWQGAYPARDNNIHPRDFLEQ
jgi:hypothetical protein